MSKLSSCKVDKMTLKLLAGTLEAALQGIMQAGADILGQGEEFSVTVEFDGLLGAVVHRVAVIAVGQVRLEGLLQRRIDVTVQISTEFFHCLLAIHQYHPRLNVL